MQAEGPCRLPETGVEAFIEAAFVAAHQEVYTVTAQGQTCCNSPSSICFWCSVSFLAWGVLGLIGIYWYPLLASSATTICFAIAIGCGINWFRNRTLHCAITGPGFLIAGALFLLSEIGMLAVTSSFVWTVVAILTGTAFLLEGLYAARNKYPKSTVSCVANL